MAAHQANIHVIKKDNITEHTTIPLSCSSSSSLEDSSILIRSTLFSLTANNLTYAQLGTIRNWWDAYPVPPALPEPYNNPSQYGIVPVWGYATIIESNVSGLNAGNILFGFWPSHDLPVTLRLEPADDCPGHYIEISEGRKKLMNLYNRYILRAELTASSLAPSNPEVESLAWQTIFLEAGRYISRYTFGSPPIRPLGLRTIPWTAEDADLTQAVVISLSASGKTARMFQDALVGERKETQGPLGWIGVTAGDGKGLIPETNKFATKIVRYEDVGSEALMTWIDGVGAKRVVVIDFASRGNSLQSLTTAIRTVLPNLTLTILGVGAESKPQTPSALSASLKSRAEMSDRVQMNMSGIRDRAIEVLGAEKVFEERRQAREGFVRRGGLEGMRLQWGGNGGVEGGWRALCEQTVPGDVGMVFRME